MPQTIYSFEGEFQNDLALYLIPKDHRLFYTVSDQQPKRVQHQYGCLSCRRFEVVGRLERVPEPLATKLDNLIGRCDIDLLAPFHIGREIHWPPGSRGPLVTLTEELRESLIKDLSHQTGLEIEDVLGEALIKLKDGRWVLTNNCD